MCGAMTIDLNCDLGEGAGHDEELLALATTANVCCGVHAGSEAESVDTLVLADFLRIRVGAHPGYDDRDHFGRRDLQLGEEALYELCRTQVANLRNWARAVAGGLTHIKPHGALYNQACHDTLIARPIVAVARHFNLPIMALPNS